MTSGADRPAVDPATRPGVGRIAYLDGLRGLAVLAVMAWHYTNWGYEKFLPYGTAFAAVPVLDHGWVGVNVFFIISGFVILMTLESCTTFAEFMARRWSRLFPAMLLASLIIFAASRVLGEHMPHGEPPAVNLLPGLSFVIPTFWAAVLQRPVDELDGVYWTLYVEMGFYLVFGSLYFRLGWRRGLAALTSLWLFTIASSRLAGPLHAPWLATAIVPLQGIGVEYFGWFVGGALFCRAAQTTDDRLFTAAILACLTSAMTSDLWQPGDALSRAYLVGCAVLFAATQRLAMVRRWLATPGLLVAGAASYPLYLLHNELGIGLIGKAGTLLPPASWRLLPFAMMAIMLFAAWLVARRVEPVLTARLRAALTGSRGHPRS